MVLDPHHNTTPHHTTPHKDPTAIGVGDKIVITSCNQGRRGGKRNIICAYYPKEQRCNLHLDILCIYFYYNASALYGREFAKEGHFLPVR